MNTFNTQEIQEIFSTSNFIDQIIFIDMFCSELMHHKVIIKKGYLEYHEAIKCFKIITPHAWA